MSPEILQGIQLEALRDKKAPGVYELQSFGLPRRLFFSTGVPVFLGTIATAIPDVAKEKRPKPHMLSLWSQFSSHVGHTGHMGKTAQVCPLAYAVRGFFENGGHWCYVVVLKDRSETQLAAGLEAIADLTTVDLVCVPDLNPDTAIALTQQQMVLDHCHDRGNRFAILDSRLGDAPADALIQLSAMSGRNGAFYYPWVRVSGFDGGLESVPPCGHVAGVINRIDRDRGVHKAPANEVLSGVIDLERRLTNHDQESLNPYGVNCLRSFPGRGIRIWGARTVSKQPDWIYVNVCRLFLTTARWLDWNLTEMDFEPNNPQLWARIERRLTEYFATQYRMGALKGASLKEAFYVKCDADTNPPELRESGQVVTEIGLAPAVPFEFVVVRLIRGNRGAGISGNSTIDVTA
jgi:hypothetical protein